MTESLPRTMTAIEIAKPGGPETLRAVTRPVPAPGPGEVLVRVEAAGVNRPDVLQRLGQYNPPPGTSDIPGLEIAGRIVGLGEGVTAWRQGEALTALVAGGGYAEYCVVPTPQALPIPAGFDMVRAAALPETFFTVWANVFDRARLVAGQSLLVHGGASGIGTTAIQLGRAFGARVFATAGGPEKCATCERLGALRAIDYHRQDFVDAIESLTGGKGVDVILDMVGGDYVNRNLRVLAVEGRLVQIAFLKGSKVEINLLPVMMKRQTITGSTLRPRSVAEKGAIAAALRDKVWPLLERGEVAPVIDRTFPLEEAAGAHRLMESGAHIGKIVLTVTPSA
jgi:putative PIG3 family NAD(P)H quinone oxidoreductase